MRKDDQNRWLPTPDEQVTSQIITVGSHQFLEHRNFSKTLFAGQGAVRHLPWFQNVSPRCRAPSLGRQ